MLESLAKHFLIESDHPEFKLRYKETSASLKIEERITPIWTQTFMELLKIVSRTQSGKDLSPQRRLSTKRTVAYHSGTVSRKFVEGSLDETHLIINEITGKTLSFIGDEKVSYADVVSGSQDFAMVVKLSGGINAKVSVPFLIF
ncbi:hypothetical protein GEMRC1_006002 [Eukaryota sp. GEM-RC1]